MKPYLEAKQISPKPGRFIGGDGRSTYIPAHDEHGKVWTMQYIQEDGTKRFAKDSRGESCFHDVGGLNQLARASALVIAEGYAIAATLSDAFGYATVAAFDSSNLPLVVAALKARFPDKPVVIPGDNDVHVEHTQDINPGRT